MIHLLMMLASFRAPACVEGSTMWNIAPWKMHVRIEGCAAPVPDGWSISEFMHDRGDPRERCNHLGGRFVVIGDNSRRGQGIYFLVCFDEDN